MNKQSIGSALIVTPLLTSVLLTLFNIDYAWHYSQNYQQYDLIHSCIAFIIICTGIYLALKKDRFLVISFAVIFFSVYQTLGWELSAKRSLSSIPLNSTTDIVIVPYDMGAFSTNSHVNIELATSHFFFFLTQSHIKSYNNIAEGQLTRLNDTIVVELKNYDGLTIKEHLPLTEFTTQKSQQ